MCIISSMFPCAACLLCLLGGSRLLELQIRPRITHRLLQRGHLLAVLPAGLQLGLEVGGGLHNTQRKQQQVLRKCWLCVRLITVCKQLRGRCLLSHSVHVRAVREVRAASPLRGAGAAGRAPAPSPPGGPACW